MIPLSYNNLLPNAPLTELTLLVFDRIRWLNFVKLQQQMVSHITSFYCKYYLENVSSVNRVDRVVGSMINDRDIFLLYLLEGIFCVLSLTFSTTAQTDLNPLSCGQSIW
jgi:hypothetical protein